MEEMMAHITAESSGAYTDDTRVSGKVIDSNGVLMAVLGDDGYRYTVTEASNGKDRLLNMHDGSRRQVKGIVSEICIEP